MFRDQQVAVFLAIVRCSMQIRIGSRQSPLARWQAHWVAEQLTRLGHQVEILWITTTGDVTQGALTQQGGSGLFTKEIQRAVLDGRCDLAVHSLKDLPTEPVDGLTLAAVPPREDPRDALVTLTPIDSIFALPKGGRIGSGSPRRAAQLRKLRPDLEVVPIRGNVDTRLRKLQDEGLDAILLATAGLKRLAVEQHAILPLPTDQMLPAVGQAALGLEIAADRGDLKDALAELDDPATHQAVLAERSMLRALRGGCLAPVAALAACQSGRITLRGAVFDLDGSRSVQTTAESVDGDPIALGQLAAKLLISGGSSRFIAPLRPDPTTPGRSG
ncbi:MAG: hydroxymethylbilane synthase [Pirellulaceae bacterium]